MCKFALSLLMGLLLALQLIPTAFSAENTVRYFATSSAAGTMAQDSPEGECLRLLVNASEAPVRHDWILEQERLNKTYSDFLERLRGSTTESQRDIEQVGTRWADVAARQIVAGRELNGIGFDKNTGRIRGLSFRFVNMLSNPLQNSEHETGARAMGIDSLQIIFRIGFLFPPEPGWIRTQLMSLRTLPQFIRHVKLQIETPDRYDLQISAALTQLSSELRNRFESFEYKEEPYSFVCFLAGTRIETIQGLKPIESIQRGDRVLAYNPSRLTQEWAIQPVIRKSISISSNVLSVVLTNGNELRVTAAHPFYVPAAKRFIPAAKLTPRDVLVHTREARNREIGVQSVKPFSGEFEVYNFEVMNDHTYCAEGVVVHNGSCQRF